MTLYVSLHHKKKRRTSAVLASMHTAVLRLAVEGCF